MTVNTTDITSGPYVGNGVTTEFAFDFRIEDQTELKIAETDTGGNETILVVGVDYTVAGVGVDGGGTVTRSAGALPSGYTWYIRSDYDVTQQTDFESQGGFFPDIHEAGFDKLTFLIQQLYDLNSRTFRISDTDPDTGAIVSLPSASERANKFIGFDSIGALIVEENIGQWAGDWVTATVYKNRDIYRDPITSSVYYVVAEHTSAATIAADVSAGNVELLIDAAIVGTKAAEAAASAAAAATSESNAATSETNAAASESAADADATQTAADRVQTGLDRTAAAASEASAEAWAESVTEPGGPGSKSAKTWAGEAAASAGAHDRIPARNQAMNQEPISQGTATRTGMSSTTYTGNGTSQSVNTGVDMATGDLGGLVWLKSRSGTSGHLLVDTLRGVTAGLQSNTTGADIALTVADFASFDSSGFTMSGSGGSSNVNLTTYVAWSFQTNQKTSGTTNRNKAYTAHYNADMGFSIVGYEGDGVAGHEIPHHLGQAPELSIWKDRGNVRPWNVQSPLFGSTEFLRLDASDALTSSAGFEAIFTDDTVSLGTNDRKNGSADNYIAYHFSSVPGVSKIGKYLGNGVGGNYVDCGFKAGFLMVKNVTTGATNWVIGDEARGETFLYANASAAEGASNWFGPADEGFVIKATSSETNALNDEYLFLAFADSGSGPTTYSYPTTDDTLTVNQNTLLSFANGFNTGQVDTQELVGAGITATLGAGFENKHLWMYKDKAGVYGFSEYRPLEGITRNDADKWGVVSPVDASLRTTAKHFDYQSATGVANASGEAAGFEAFKAFDKLGGVPDSPWAVASITTSWLQYKGTEARVLKSWRLKPNTVAQSPRRFTIEGSNDGLNWIAIDSTYTASDFTAAGDNLWSAVHATSGNTAAYLYHRINITANTSDPTFTGVEELEFNTILPSDYYLVNEGQMYNSSDVAIERVYLAEVRTGGTGDVTFLRNLPVAKHQGDSAELQGDLTVHGEIQSRHTFDASCTVDGTQNPPLIQSSVGVQDVVDLVTGQFRVYFDPDIVIDERVQVQLTARSAAIIASHIIDGNAIRVYLHSHAGTPLDHPFTLHLSNGKELK